VSVVSALTVPAPTMRAHATCAPLKGLLSASVTFATKGAASAFFTVSDCPPPDAATIATGSPGVARFASWNFFQRGCSEDARYMGGPLLDQRAASVGSTVFSTPQFRGQESLRGFTVAF